jgi:hypothetical protein
MVAPDLGFSSNTNIKPHVCRHIKIEYSHLWGIEVDLAGFEPAASSVRLKWEALSASSAAYFRGFYPLEIRKNGGKTAKMSIFYHARQLWLQMVANGCKRHEEGIADPTLS